MPPDNPKQPAALTAAVLADALGCFWNAAIGDAHNRQSSLAMDCASVMAEGFAAVAHRLNEHAAPVVEDPRIATMASALGAAERFIVGFEGDETQEGIAELLATMRAASQGAPAANLTAASTFIEQMARFTTPEDEFDGLKGEDGIARDDGVTYADVDEYIADMSDDRLMGEYAAFLTMIRGARQLLGAADTAAHADGGAA